MPGMGGGLGFASTWTAPGTEGLATLEGGPAHQRKPTRLKITGSRSWERLRAALGEARAMGLAGLGRT